MKFRNDTWIAGGFPPISNHFDGGKVADTLYIEYVVGMVIYVRRWHDLPVIGGNTY